MNNRRAPRSRTFKSGTISLGDRSLDCLIRNISATGACLELKGTATIPTSFKLTIKPDSLFRDCKVVWQDGHRVGVLFEPGRSP
jgi:PilZ domain